MTKKLPGLQILRGICALLVCCFHARKLLNGDHNYGDFLFGNGFIGVPLFFLVSGFIMVYTTKNLKEDSLGNFKVFIQKRIFRIVPLYYVATVTWIIITHSYIDYTNQTGFVRLVKSFLFIPTGQKPPLGVGWTLNYEMFFYLIFGVSFFAGRFRYIFLYVVLLMLIFVIPLYFNTDSLSLSIKRDLGNHYLNLITNPLLLFFLLGMLIGNTYERINLKKSTTRILLLLSIVIFGIYYFQLFSLVEAEVIVLIICGLLVFSVVHMDKFRINKYNNNSLVYLGDISYSIYLIHPLMISLVSFFMNIFGHSSLIAGVFQFVLIVIFTVGSSMITFEMIEKRFTKLKKRL